MHSGSASEAFIWPMRLLALVAWAVASLRDRRITPLLFDVAAKRLAMGNVPQVGLHMASLGREPKMLEISLTSSV